MDPGPEKGDRVDVAVGPDRAVAARVFGDRFDSALVTTYDAFDRDVDLRTVSTLGVTAGPGLDSVHERVEHDHDLWPMHVLVGLPPDLAGREHLDAALRRRPSIAVSRTTETERGLVLDLDHAANVPPEDGRRALAKIAAHGLGVTEPVSVPSPHGLARLDARQRLVLLAAAAAVARVVVLAVVLVVVGRSGGVDGVLVTLVTLALLGEGAIALGTAYVMVLARQARARQEHLRHELTARTDRLLELARDAARHDDVALRELEQVRAEITALGRLGARARIEARERS
jgi:hypothetical protein